MSVRASDDGEPISELRRSRDQLAVILATISDGVTVQRPDGRVIFANDAAALVIGFRTAAELLAASPGEVLGRFEIRDEHGAIIPPGDLPGRRALRGETSQVTMHVLDRRTGAQHWSLVSATPVRNDAGEVELAVNIFTDLTERKRSEEAWRFLAEASAALGSSLTYERTLAEVARLAVPSIADWCVVDIVGPSGQPEPLAVAHGDPVQAAAAEELLRGGDRDAGIAEVVSTGRARLLGGGALSPALVGVSGLRSAMIVPLTVGDRAFGTITFANAESGRHHDQADLRLAQEIARRASLAIENARAYKEAHEAVRTRDTFLSIASHELKTPMSSLTLLLSGLSRALRQGRLGERDDDRILARVQKIEEQADRLVALTHQLLDVSRLAAGGFALRREEADLVDVGREVLARFQDAATQLGVPMTLTTHGSLRGRWDRSRLDQVLTNLVTNALKYGAGTPVSIEMVGEGDAVHLTVSDRGPGIAESDQRRIFEQYERAASTNLGGLGLGLWIVRQLAQAHGGDIVVRSRPAEGAAFTVSLPRT